VLAVTAFASLAVAAGFFQGTSIDDVVGWIVVTTAVLMILVLCIPRLRRRIFGLVERMFYFSMISWFIIVGVELLLLVS
jgi:ABC-type multidrug transport system permease subunit